MDIIGVATLLMPAARGIAGAAKVTRFRPNIKSLGMGAGKVGSFSPRALLGNPSKKGNGSGSVKTDFYVYPNRTVVHNSGPGTPRIFSSPDKYVGELATAIDARFPGRVADVNKVIYKQDGISRLTDFDIELTDVVIQVKSGSGKGLTSQLIDTSKGTTKPVIGYVPDINPRSALVRGAKKEGYSVFTSYQDLMDYLDKN